MIKYKIHILSFIVLLNVGLISKVAALSEEAQFDLLKQDLVVALRMENYGEALHVMGKLKATGNDLGTEIIYFEALSLWKTGKVAAAQNKVDDYINKAGRKGANYSRALALYKEIEEQGRNIIAEQQAAAERERQKQAAYEAEQARKVGKIISVNSEWNYAVMQTTGVEPLENKSLYFKINNNRINIKLGKKRADGTYTLIVDPNRSPAIGKEVFYE